MSQRDSLESLYKFTLDKYDSVSVANNDLSGKLTSKQSEISKLKGEISSILRKRNATAAELNKAKTLIEELNSKITTLEAEVTRLTGENQVLTTEKAALTVERDSIATNLNTTLGEKKVLEETVDVGSTFSASNIMITPIEVATDFSSRVFVPWIIYSLLKKEYRDGKISWIGAAFGLASKY